MIPMYLAYRPPEMLPTGPLSPVKSKKAKRQSGGWQGTTFSLGSIVSKDSLANPDRWLWVGVVMSAMGSLALFFS